MYRWLKALTLTLALAALNMVSVSCGSSDQAQVRFVHAMEDGAAMDIYINGPTDVNPNLVFINVSFLGIQPTQPGYSTVPSGTDTIEGLLSGTSNIGFNSTPIDLNGGQQYTVIATGFVANGQNAVILPIADDIPTPESNYVAFRAIHASPSGPSNVDIYIQLNPTSGPSGSPAISGLGYEHASGYVSLPNNPNNDTLPPGFTAYVTLAGSTVPIFTEQINPLGGAVRSLVLTDVQNAKTMSQSFLELSDLN
jgi:hypothetical protein